MQPASARRDSITRRSSSPEFAPRKFVDLALEAPSPDLSRSPSPVERSGGGVIFRPPAEGGIRRRKTMGLLEERGKGRGGRTRSR